MTKWIFSSDWHFGNADNSEKHNQHLIDFTEFMVSYAREHNIINFAHLGDYFHQRDKINVLTLNYAAEAIDIISKHFKTKIFLKGNHDLFYRDSRLISGLEPFRNKIHLIDDMEIIDNIAFMSWVCSGEEFSQAVTELPKQVQYVCGHFEFTSFQMNDHYIMEHGYPHKALKKLKHVFTGHYHKRQERDNVSYIGSPFPFDFNDANDSERGFVVFDSDTGLYEYINYEKVKVVTVSYQEFLATDNYASSLGVDPENVSIRIDIPETVEDSILEEVNNKLDGTSYNSSRVNYKGGKIKEIMEQETDIEGITNIDDAIVVHLSKMEPIPDIDNSLLADLYKKACEAELG